MACYCPLSARTRYILYGLLLSSFSQNSLYSLWPVIVLFQPELVIFSMACYCPLSARTRYILYGLLLSSFSQNSLYSLWPVIVLFQPELVIFSIACCCPLSARTDHIPHICDLFVARVYFVLFNVVTKII